MRLAIITGFALVAAVNATAAEQAAPGPVPLPTQHARPGTPPASAPAPAPAPATAAAPPVNPNPAAPAAKSISEQGVSGPAPERPPSRPKPAAGVKF
jgi:hypothetical protein